MNSTAPLYVALSQPTIELLLNLRERDDDSIDTILARHFKPGINAKTATKPVAASQPSSSPRPSVSAGGYRGQFLGRILQAETLGAFFSEIVDIMCEVAPDVVHDFAQCRARTRHYVSRTPVGVHGGRSDLPIHKTTTGWYVSKNIGRRDLVRGLKVLCSVARLKYGSDLSIE